MCALTFLGCVKPHEPDALAVHVDRIAVEDIDILGGNRVRMRRCYREQHHDRPRMVTHHAATLPRALGRPRMARSASHAREPRSATKAVGSACKPAITSVGAKPAPPNTAQAL